MVQFGTGYYMPMDREFETNDYSHHRRALGSETDSKTDDVGISIGDLGMSLGLGPVPNVQAVQAKLRPGSKKLELGFMGMGKGSGQGHTPGMYGKKQRQALTEIAEANKVDFTTHASVGVYGLAGMDQQGNFSKASKNVSLLEVKRAVEFASDVAKGGVVVLHTGEFNRSVVDADWNKREGDPYAKKFEMFEGEEERTAYRVVDTRTGGVIQEARKNRKVSRPVWNTAEEGKEYIDFNGNKKVAKEMRDENGMIIYLDPFDKRVSSELRVPQFDHKNQRFKIREMEWEDLEEESKDMTLRARQVWKEWKSGKISNEEFEKSYWGRFKDAGSAEQIKVRAEEAYIIASLETNAANSRGWALYYGGDFEESVEQVKKLRKAEEFYKKMEDEIDPQEKWRLKQAARDLIPGLVPEDARYPTEIIKAALQQAERRIRYSQESSASQWAQSEESVETIRHVESAQTYAVKEAWQSYANAGINALRYTEKLERKGQLKKPIVIAMENLFPEHYGAHPDELKNLVLGSREEMKNILVKQGMAEEEAKRKAEKHITSTFDTGHFNMWRKYWKGDPQKTVEQNDNEFKKWMVQKVGELAKENVIGHIHLSDNFGYQDDHLAPGEGSTPIKEMLKVLKESGYKGETIVEPGADYTTDLSGFHSVMKTWRHFGTPVYGTASGISGGANTWGQVGYGFFGQNQPAYFVFGAYSPSEDWTLWSGVPLE